MKIEERFNPNLNFCDKCRKWKENVEDIDCELGFAHQICKECCVVTK